MTGSAWLIAVFHCLGATATRTNFPREIWRARFGVRARQWLGFSEPHCKAFIGAVPKMLVFAAVLSSAAARAQESRSDLPPESSMDPTRLGGLSWDAGVNLGYVGGSSAKFQGAHLGDSDAFNYNLSVGTRFLLNDAWFLNLGLGSDNFSLESLPGGPVPGDIHTLRINTGLVWRLNDEWTFTAHLSPSLYRYDDVRSDDFGIAGGLMAMYHHRNSSVTWIFGIFASPDSDVPVLPMVGVRWRINDHYTLEVGMPKTRLSYRLNSNWTFYGGLDLNGTTFRTSNDLGTKIGLPDYNNALATYRDIRLGVGAGCKIWRGLRAEIETGVSVYREINYKRIDTSVDFNPAPYVRMGLSARF